MATRIPGPASAMRKAPRQARSRATIEAILDAAAHILGERGWAATTTNAVAERAGASTVAELTVVGLPSILVPLPGAPGDHQAANADRLARAGAAIVVPDSEVDPTRLGAELDRLLAKGAEGDGP